MRSWQETRLTGAVKRHDEKLFVKKDDFGRMSVWRESYALRPYEISGSVIQCLEPAPHYIMSLTENWTMNAKPCEWGVEPILERLKSIDAWNRDSFVNSEMEENNRRVDESKQRSINNKIEDATYEAYGTFKKVFADINTANINKIKKPLKGA